jgi:isoquinoline 1-oxidoreductase beta subunit
MSSLSSASSTKLAHLARQDPYLFRRRLLENPGAHPIAPRSKFDGTLADPARMIHMLDLVTEKAGWGEPLGPNRGRGISCFFSKTTYLAQVAEVTVDGGNLRVDRVITVVDPGRVINMNGIRAQIEGAVLMGLSAALKERITVKDGMIQQQNFNSYDLLRMPDSPQLETYLVEGGRPPGGIGEPPLALIGPSVGNAIFDATGKRLRISFGAVSDKPDPFGTPLPSKGMTEIPIAIPAERAASVVLLDAERFSSRL